MHVPGLVVNNPVDLARVRDVLAAMPLDASSVVLDVGCGRGEMLAVLAETAGCRVVGVEPRPEEIARARARLAPFGPRAVLHACGIAEAPLGDRPFDAALCIGATHAFGGPGDGYPRTLDALGRLVRPGGSIVVGEGYWRKPPDPAYLAATGMSVTDLGTHEANVEAAQARGLTVVTAMRSTKAEWDRFEGLFWAAAEEHLRRNPDDPAALETARHWRSWRAAYLEWGRETLGFALYLCRVRA